MMDAGIIALRMERQHLTRKADEAEYLALYRDLQPGVNVFWHGFGDPPTLSHRAVFNDMEYNRKRQRNRSLIKGRFTGGNLGWIVPEDIELFAGAFAKPLTALTLRHTTLLDLVRREPLTIQQMKEETGMLVKEITPVLHRLQEAFLIYEDQYDGEWDRGWHPFTDMFPGVDLQKHTRHEALKVLLSRFAYRMVYFDIAMAKAFYKLPGKDLQKATDELLAEGVLITCGNGYVLKDDAHTVGKTDTDRSKTADNLDADQTAAIYEAGMDYGTALSPSVFVIHRNDILVKTIESELKARFTHDYPDTMHYLLVDGVFRGFTAGKFRYTLEIEDVILDLPREEAAARKDEVLDAVRALCGEGCPIKRFQGVELSF